jgi:hypothetical protein
VSELRFLLFHKFTQLPLGENLMTTQTEQIAWMSNMIFWNYAISYRSFVIVPVKCTDPENTDFEVCCLFPHTDDSKYHVDLLPSRGSSADSVAKVLILGKQLVDQHFIELQSEGEIQAIEFYNAVESLEAIAKRV